MPITSSIDWVVDLEEAVVVVKKKNGKLKIPQSYDLSKKGEG